jgi:hypothetical protein
MFFQSLRRNTANLQYANVSGTCNKPDRSHFPDGTPLATLYIVNAKDKQEES